MGIDAQGQVLMLFLLVLIAAADVGAYFGGRALGRRKLAPRVSPGKTWEGFAAGMLAAMLAACGQKGPLTLAAPAPSASAASAAAAPR